MIIFFFNDYFYFKDKTNETQEAIQPVYAQNRIKHYAAVSFLSTPFRNNFRQTSVTCSNIW